MIKLVCFVWLCAVGNIVQAQVTYQRPHELLVAAIKQGSSSGTLVGPVADMFTKQFRSAGPLTVSAQVIGHYTRADCKRLEVVYRKDGAMTDKGPRPFVLNTKMNYCLDGRPPVGLEQTQ